MSVEMKRLVLPVAALATPVVFLGDWLGRSLFALDARPEPKP